MRTSASARGLPRRPPTRTRKSWARFLQTRFRAHAPPSALSCAPAFKRVRRTTSREPCRTKMNSILRSCAMIRRFALSMLLMPCAVMMLGATYFPSGLGEGAHSPADAIVSGLYPGQDSGSCCWMGPKAVLRLTAPAVANTVVLVFAVPNYAPFRAQTERLTLQIQGKNPEIRCCYGPGEHAVLLVLPPRRAAVSLLSVTAALSFVPKDLGINEDPRRLSVLIRSFQYRSSSGSLILPAGTAVAQAVPMTPFTFAAFVLIFVVALVLAWRRPIYAIALLIVLGPFGPSISLGFTTITFFKTAIVGTLIGFAPRAPWKELWGRREALIPIACIGGLVAATVISFTNAEYRGPVLRETLKYVEYAIVFAVSFLAYRIEPDRRPVGVAFVLVTGAVCLAALSQESTGAPETAFVLGHIVPRIAGPLEGPNQLAGWLEIIVPVLLCVRLQKPLRAAGTLVAVLAILTSMLTLSRAGMLGMVIGIAVFAIASQRAEGRRVTPFAIVASLAAIATLAYRALPQRPNAAGDSFNGGLGTRGQLWHAAVTLWRSHPLTGVGAGNYETQLGSVGLIGVRTHANSWYLQSLAEGGIVMFAAVVATIYGLISTFIESRALLATAALAATAAICAHQFFDDLIFFPKVGTMWWLILGVAAAAAASSRLIHEDPSAGSHQPNAGTAGERPPPVFGASSTALRHP